MTSRTHDVFAFASLVTLAAYFPPDKLNTTTLLVSFVGSIVGSLLPDVDQVSNRLWDLIPAGHIVGKIFDKLFFSHRGISHSFLGVFLVYKLLDWVLLKVLNPSYINIQIVFASIMIGFISHLVIDAFTEEGIPIFFPIKWKVGFPPIKSWRIKTGKWFEKFVVFPGIILYLFWFSINHQKILINILKPIVK